MAQLEHEQQLLARWIEPDPYSDDPAEVRLVGSGVHVWAIIGYLPAVNQDLAQAAADYAVPREAVEAAVASYAGHCCPIDARLAANAA
ncbi:MAG TPA: hypothetical protein VFW96_20965 [Thermomicrobiales bacterium]|nr:hypothetical protein [Thermomicrobiales bacterium]